ncbi:MAG: hypothetical protein M3N43_02410, partial [Actinomycetota bacterium]|nr:hypothetical protein [Actinomycetota bacterium]
MLWVLGAVGITAACGSSSKTPAAAQAGSAGATAGGSGSGSGGSASGAGTGGASQAQPIELEDLCPIFTQDLCVYLMECQG